MRNHFYYLGNGFCKQDNSKDDVEIEVRYGDLMKIAFPKKKDKIVVIAVNRCFDMVVNQDIIFEGSVHGQFIKRDVHNDSERAVLESNIKKSLSRKKWCYIY